VPRTLQLITVFIVYFFSGWVGIHFAGMGEGSLTLIWLPSGIALSALLIFGKSIWPAIWLASFAANTPYLINEGSQYPLIIAAIYGGLAATINTSVQGILAQHLFTKHIGKLQLKTSKSILTFVFQVIMIPSMLNMALLVLLYSIGGYTNISANNVFYQTIILWLSGALADFHGYFVVVPFVLSWYTRPKNPTTDKSILLTLSSMCLFIILMLSLFIVSSAIYLLLILGVLVALYLGFRSSTLLVLLVSLTYTFATASQIGPFDLNNNWTSFLSLLMFIFSFGLPIYIISAKKYELKQANIHLEEKVIERTDALNSANKMLENISLTDGLTGVANRRHLDEFLETEWARAIRNKTTLSLLMIDIDFFKQYNDIYGHLAGDECLQLIAQKIQQLVQRPSDLVARYGGEEFVVVLPETQQVENIAEDIIREIKKLAIAHCNSSVSDIITISVGCATLQPKQGDQHSQLIDLADKQLYLAKNDGRNKIKIHS